MKKNAHILSIIVLSFIIFSCSKNGGETITIPKPITVTDADGNIYRTVVLGDQIWMTENLKTTKYNDGTAITEYTINDDWYNGNTPIAYYQWASTADLNDIYDIELPFGYYGVLYNEFAVQTGKLAPDGWRIPTIEDFEELETFLKENDFGDTSAVLRSTTGWINDFNGTDKFGFNALPNGYASAFGTSTATETVCSWITSNVDNATQIRTWVQLDENTNFQFTENSIRLGTGIRLIKED